MVSYCRDRKVNDNLPPASRVVRPKDKICLLLILALNSTSFLLSAWWEMGSVLLCVKAP